MSTVSIQLPDSIAGVFGKSGDVGDSILSAAVVKWYELGRVSEGKAAEILRLSRVEFLDLLSSYRVSAWQYSQSEIDDEIAQMDDVDDLRQMIAAKLYERGTLSLGQGAELAGVSKRDFMGMLGRYNVSIFNYPASHLDRDIANAKNYRL